MSALVETLPGRCEGAHAAKICVLNALRHQRMVQRGTYPDEIASRWVLNALRHQRMVQTNALALVARMVKCSTPYGIRGWCSIQTSCTSLIRIVLNALRPLRMVQKYSALRQIAPTMCSTPYGIRGWCSDSIKITGTWGF